ncbi:RagB/SusD family nutrient uptake outer membrane protein [Niabella aquatica]
MKIFVNKRIFIAIAGLALIGLFSCNKQLDLYPENGETSSKVYSTLEGTRGVIAKVYGAYSLPGQDGDATPDIPGIKADFSDFIRVYFNLQELPTEEVVCSWGDNGIQDFHGMNWSASNPYIKGMYSRSLFQITMANEFIRNTSDEALNARGFSASDIETIKYYRAEARFLRAFQYWVLMDLYGNPPFVTEHDPIGTFLPPQKTSAEIFEYVESELKAIEPLMLAPKSNDYGRADQAAVWALLARIYLNAKTYTGTERYTDAITYSSKVINAGFSLNTEYKRLFMADNNLNNPEIILAIGYDGVHSHSWGGTTFIINSSCGGGIVSVEEQGVSGNAGWAGNRTTKSLPLLFGDYSGNMDKRAQFAGPKIEIDNVSTFTDGLSVKKFTNKKSDGTIPAFTGDGAYCSTDFPLFRLAEQYLIYAEAVKRGGQGGSEATALSYVNALRTRAYGNASGNITAAQLTTNFILDERGRELYWEGFRRTDLIRYGLLTSGSYLWPWKGGVKDGKGVADKYNLYPIPSSEIVSNPNMKQNLGY